ncbi:Nop14-like family-domain-containing protein [Lactifluus volemus]|nr:Nop14-like family-domain-containing protein [Lactifluus volemus]
MGKGSQLSQLKSALSQAGLSRQPQPGRKRKRAQNEERDNAKRAARLHEIQQKLNPFDIKVTKLKHDVGGRKLKGVSGKPAQSKQAGIDARKRTLLKEFEERGRAGGILDRRFGENDPTLTPEERMLERFTRERQRASKGAAFHLEDEADLTHYGQSLSNLDDFAGAGLELDSDEEETKHGQIDSEVVKKSHFGGFESGSEDGDEPAYKKTKAEVMAEVIAKSKEHKALRQKQREEADDIRYQLDQELDTIRGLLSGPDPLSESLEQKLSSQAVGAAGEDRDQQYDQFVRELIFDQRSKPKDRAKTDEELALEAKCALEKAERRRIRRMNGEDDAIIGGDDLEDDFNDANDLDGLGGGLKSIVEGTSESGSSVDDTNDEDSSASEYGAQHDDLETPWHGFSDASGSEPSDLDGSARYGLTDFRELPYTFPCPSSHEEFLDIIKGIADQDIPTVVERIRALHHPSLGAENPSRLQVLAGVLIDHILHVTSSPDPQLSVVSDLLLHIRALTNAYPRQTAEHFIRKLSLMHKNLRRGLNRSAVDCDAKTWPGLPELVLLRTLGALWPTSDMHHVVVSPARLLMGSYLGLCKISLSLMLPVACFSAHCFFSYQLLDQYFPVTVTARRVPAESGRSSPPSQRHHNGQLCVIGKGEAKTLSVNRPDLVAIIGDKRVTAQTNVDLLGLTTLSGFVELYGPVLQILGDIDSDVLCSSLQNRISRTVDITQRLMKFSRQERQPLRLQSHKPIPIPSYNRTAQTYKEERKGAIRELRKDARYLAGVEQEKQRDKDKSYHERMKRVFGSIEVERAEEKALERVKARDKRRAGRK